MLVVPNLRYVILKHAKMIDKIGVSCESTLG